MHKHPRAPHLSRGFLLVGFFTLGTGACAGQSAPAYAEHSSTQALRPLAPRPVRVGGEDVNMLAEYGSIDRDDAEAAITDNWPRLKNCYQEAGAAMAFAEGGVSLRFEVDGSGRTTGVEVTESKLGNFAVESCLGGVARAIRFPRPHGGGHARVDYTLEFRSTDERPVLELPRDLTEVMRLGLLAHVQTACGALGANDAEATAYVDRRGHVVSAGMGSKTALAPERAACAANALAMAVVCGNPAPDGDALVRLTFGLSDADLSGARSALAAVTKSNARSRASKERQGSKERLASKVRRR